MSVVTLLSGTYCGWQDVVERAAEELGYARVGEELLQDAAQRSGMATETLARALKGDRGFFDTFTHSFDKSLVYLRAAIADLLETDGQVLTGPASLLVPKEIGHVLHVELTADREYQVQLAIDRDGIDIREAEDRVDKSLRDTEQWTDELTSRGLWDPTAFDVRMRRPATSLEVAVETIVECARRPVLRATSESIQRVVDFQLAAKVALDLLERGHPDCTVTAEEGRITVHAAQKSGPGKLSRTMHALRWESLDDEVRATARERDDVVAAELMPAAADPEPVRTLLVDDERDYVLTLSDRLQMRDIPSDVAHDGLEAIKFVETDVPDVMVLDLRMPGMDGMEVLRRIKRDHPGVEVIIVTGHGSDKDEEMARKLGAFDYLQKPVNISILAERIRAASEAALGAANDETSDGSKAETSDA